MLIITHFLMKSLRKGSHPGKEKMKSTPTSKRPKLQVFLYSTVAVMSLSLGMYFWALVFWMTQRSFLPLIPDDLKISAGFLLFALIMFYVHDIFSTWVTLWLVNWLCVPLFGWKKQTNMYLLKITVLCFLGSAALVILITNLR
jgi:hypothetical protein